MDSFVLTTTPDERSIKRRQGTAERISSRADLSNIDLRMAKPLSEIRPGQPVDIFLVLPGVLGRPENLKDSFLHRTMRLVDDATGDEEEHLPRLEAFCKTQMMQLVIDFKMKSYCMYFFYMNIFLYVLFFVNFILVGLFKSGNLNHIREWIDDAHDMGEIRLLKMFGIRVLPSETYETFLSVALAVQIFFLKLVFEIRAMISKKKLSVYFSTPWHWFEWLIIANSSLMSYYYYHDEIDVGNKFASVGSILSVLSCLEFALGFAESGLFVRIVIRVLREMTVFFVMMVLIIGGFALGFLFIFSGKNEKGWDNLGSQSCPSTRCSWVSTHMASSNLNPLRCATSSSSLCWSLLP